MKKKNYSNVNLTCAFQNTEELSGNQCLNGVFSKTDMDKGFDKRTFAEEVYQEIVNALKIID